MDGVCMLSNSMLSTQAQAEPFQCKPESHMQPGPVVGIEELKTSTPLNAEYTGQLPDAPMAMVIFEIDFMTFGLMSWKEKVTVGACKTPVAVKAKLKLACSQPADWFHTPLKFVLSELFNGSCIVLGDSKSNNPLNSKTAVLGKLTKGMDTVIVP